jgi:hypothetical protein
VSQALSVLLLVFFSVSCPSSFVVGLLLCLMPFQPLILLGVLSDRFLSWVFLPWKIQINSDRKEHACLFLPLSVTPILLHCTHESALWCGPCPRRVEVNA